MIRAEAEVDIFTYRSSQGVRKATRLASRFRLAQDNDQSQSGGRRYHLWQQSVRTKTTSVAFHIGLAQHGDQSHSGSRQYHLLQQVSLDGAQRAGEYVEISVGENLLCGSAVLRL